MSKHDDTDENGRRTVLKALGVSGAALAGASAPAAAHPHGSNEQDSDQSSSDSSDESGNKGRGHGYGNWCCSCGFSPRGWRHGPGYRRDYPHQDDDTEWDDEQPDDGASDGDGDGETPDETTDPSQTYDLTVVVADPDGVPVPDVDLTVDGTSPDGSEQYTTQTTTDDNGLGHFDLPSGDYTLTIADESTDYTTPEPTEVAIEDDDVAVTVNLAEAEEDPVDADTEVEEGDDTPDGSEDVETPPEEAPDEPTEGDDSEDDDSPDGSDDTPPEDDSGADSPPEGQDPDEPVETPEQPDETTDDESPEEQDVSTQIEQRIHTLVNEFRAAQGAPELEFNDELATVAREHSEDMAEEGYFSHDSPDGADPGDRIDDAGIDCYAWGENIAWESGSDVTEDDVDSVANSTVSGWINSSGHRQNLLGNYDEEGVGVFVDGGEVFTTQVFCSSD